MEKHIHYQMILVELQRYIKRKGEFMKRILRIFYAGILTAVTLCGCESNEPEQISAFLKISGRKQKRSTLKSNFYISIHFALPDNTICSMPYSTTAIPRIPASHSIVSGVFASAS